MNDMTPIHKTKLKWALSMVRGHGLAIIPIHYTRADGSCSCGQPMTGDDSCKSPGKHPVNDFAPHGVNSATRDETAIKSWFMADGKFNYAVPGTAEFAVVDLDIKTLADGTIINGIDNYAALIGADPWEVGTGTFAVETPGGGTHLYQKTDKAYVNRVGVIPGVDMRSKRGYVLGPGSRNYVDDGKGGFVRKAYVCTNEAPFAPMHEAFKAKLAATRERSADAQTSKYPKTVDSAENIAQAISFLKERDPAIIGHGGDYHTLITSQRVRDYNISEDLCMELMEEHFNAELVEPWDYDGLKVKVRNGYRYADRPMGTKSAASAKMVDAVAGTSTEDDLPLSMRAKSTETKKEKSAYAGIGIGKDMVAGIEALPISLDDLNPVNLAGMEYCYGQSYSYGLVSVIAAPGGMGKSTLLILRAILAAVGLKYIKERMEAPGEHVDRLKALLEAGENPDDDAMVVWLWNLEDSRDNILLRVFAACTFYGIEPAVVIKSLLVNGREKRLAVAKMDESNTVRIYVPALEKVSEVIREHGVKMLLAEPFVKTIEVNDENNNTAMSTAVEAWAKLADVEGIAVGLAHNSVKWDGKDIEVYKRNAMRGAGAIRDHVRVAEVLVPMNDREKDSSILKADWKRFFYIHADKENFGPNNRARIWFTFDSVEAPAHKDSRKGLPRSIGVVTVASVNEDITSYSTEQVTAMLAAIKEHTPPGKDEKGDGKDIKPTERYTMFAEGTVQGPLNDKSVSPRHVDREFAPVLNMQAYLDSTDAKERDKASRAVATAVRVLLAKDLIERREDIYSPRQASRGGKREVDGFMLTGMGQKRLQRGIMDKEASREADDANAPDPVLEDDFGN